MTIINEDSISEDKILQDLLSYVRSKPEADRWIDYFSGSSGATLLELMSGLGGFLAYQARAARQESNLLTARLASSIYAAAFTFGYPINRKQSAVLQITGNLNGGSYSTLRNTFIQRYTTYSTTNSPIGYIDGYPISFPLNYDLESKVPMTQAEGGVDMDGLLVGEWHYYVHTISSSTAFYEINLPLLVDVKNVDNLHVHVTLNRGGVLTPNTDTIVGGTTIPLSLTRNTEDMDGTVGSETILIKTLINSVTIMFGSDAIGYKPSIGDLVLIRYLEVKEPVSDTSPNFVLGNLRLEESVMTPLYVVVTRRQTEEDSLAKIAKVIPGYFSSKRRMVTDKDHVSIVNTLPGIRDSAFITNECSEKLYEISDKTACLTADGVWRKPIELNNDCCSYLMTYLRDDETALSNTELEGVYQRLKDHQMVGENLKFRQASRVPISLSVSIQHDDTRGVAELRSDVLSAVQSQCYKIGAKFNTAKLVSDILSIKGVRLCYLRSPSIDKKLSDNAYFVPPTGFQVPADYSSSGGGGLNGIYFYTDETLDTGISFTDTSIGGYSFPPHIPSQNGFLIRGSISQNVSVEMPEAWSVEDVIYSMTNLPSGFSFDPATRLVTGMSSTSLTDTTNNILYRATERNSRYWNQISCHIQVSS